MNRTAASIASIAILSLAFSGCQKADGGAEGESNASGVRVGVLDLDKMASDLGWMKEMQSNLQNLQKQFQTEFGSAKDAYTSQILAKKKEFAPRDSDKLTQEQQQTLAQMENVARQALVQLDQAANQQFAGYRQQSIIGYRQAIGPIVQQVAEEKKLWLVVEKGGPVIYSLPAGEITDTVVDIARAHPPILHPVPLPQLPGPGTIAVNPATQPSSRPASAEPPKESGGSSDTH